MHYNTFETAFSISRSLAIVLPAHIVCSSHYASFIPCYQMLWYSVLALCFQFFLLVHIWFFLLLLAPPAPYRFPSCIYLYRIAAHNPPVFLVLTHHCPLPRSADLFRYLSRMYLYPVLVAFALYPTTIFTSVSFYRVATLAVIHYTLVGSGCITPSSHFTPNESSMMGISIYVRDKYLRES